MASPLGPSSGHSVDEPFEGMLSGGHPNSLGRTVDVVDLVLADRARFAELYECYFSTDEVVRLRVSNAMKRVTTAHPDWTMDYMDRLQHQVAAIDQASTQWTLALLFDLTRALLRPRQRARAVEIMQRNLTSHHDWIVLNNSMKVMGRGRRRPQAVAHAPRPSARRRSAQVRCVHGPQAPPAPRLVAQLSRGRPRRVRCRSRRAAPQRAPRERAPIRIPV